MRTKNESVVLGERKRIGNQIVQSWILQPERRLDIPALLLLAKNVSDVVGAEGLRGVGLGECAGNGVWTIISNERKQLADLPAERSIGVGKPCEIDLGSRPEQGNQAMLRSRTFRRGHLREEFFLEALGSESLPALPGTSVARDFLMLIVDRDRGRIGLDRELPSDIARRHTVAITVEGEPKIFMDERVG